MMMDPHANGSINGFLTRERFEALTTFTLDLEGLGTVRFRKIGRAEYEALWPLLPAAADEWPGIPAAPDPQSPTLEADLTARDEARKARRLAEATWLRAQSDDEQVHWRTRINDVAFRVIAACTKAPGFTVAEARQLGDAAEILFSAILTKSGLIEGTPAASPPAAVAVEAPAGAV
jgi:hypothetical protein